MGFRPPNGLSCIFGGIGNGLDGPTSTRRFDVDSLIPRGAAIRAIRPPQGVMGALPNSSRRPHPMVAAVRALRALREVQHHRMCNVCRPARNRWACAVDAQASIRFQSSRRSGDAGRRGTYVVDLTEKKNIFRWRSNCRLDSRSCRESPARTQVPDVLVQPVRRS